MATESEYSIFLRLKFSYLDERSINEFDSIFKIIKDYNNLSYPLFDMINSVNGKTLFREFNKAIQKLLITMPLYDAQLNMYIIRYSCELAIKTIFCTLYNNIYLDRVECMSFRFLKEYIKKKYNSTEINNIYSLYGGNSKIVHGEKSNNMYDVLNDLLVFSKSDYLTLKKQVKELYTNFFKIIININSIYYSEMSVGNRQRIIDFSLNNDIKELIELLQNPNKD